MPHVDGEEALREMRRAGVATPVILSSGYNEQDVAGRFSGDNLAGFIQKPYKIDALAAVLRQAIGGK